MAVGTKTTKKGSATTEVVLGQAAQQIAKAVNELNLATATVGKLAANAEDLTLMVSNKEDEIAALDIQFKEKQRQLSVDLDLSFKANTDKVVTDYLESVNRTTISKTELSTLRRDLDEALTKTEMVVKKEVAIVTSTLKSQYENEIKLIQSENKAVSAENTAKIDTLKSQNTFLEGQVTKLYAQLDAERSAGIERAKAGSVGAINVTSAGK